MLTMCHAKIVVFMYMATALIPLRCYSLTINDITEFIKNHPGAISQPPLSNFQLDLDNYFSFETSWFNKIFSHKSPLQDENLFVSLINSVEQLINPNEINKILPKATTKLIFVGPLYGRIEVLSSILQELVRQQILDNTLKITNSTYHLVFLGDLFSNSLTSQEALLVALDMINKNPQNVTYIKGNYETESFWENFSLKNQLIHLMPKTHATISMRLSNLFNKLPQNIFWENTVCCYDATKLNAKALSPRKYHILCGLHSSKNPLKYNENMVAREFIAGCPVWPIISSTMHNNNSAIHASNIFYTVHYNQSQPILEEFVKEASIENFKKILFDPWYGVKTDKTVQKKHIPVIASFNIAGKGSILFKNIHKTACATINLYNQAHYQNASIPFIDYIVLDDAFVPARAQANILELKKLTKSKIIYSPNGTACINRYIHLAANGEASIILPIMGQPLRAIPNTCFYRPSYEQESYELTNYIIKNYSPTHVTILYEDDDFGRKYLPGIKQACNDISINLNLLPYSINATKSAEIAAKITASPCDILGIFGLDDTTLKILQEIGASFFIDKPIFCCSYLMGKNFKKICDSYGLHTIFSSIIPNPLDSSIPIANKFLDNPVLRKKDAPSFEGFLSANMFIRFLETAHFSEDPSTLSKIIQTIEIKDFLKKPLKINPTTNSFAQSIWIIDTKLHGTSWVEIPINLERELV